MINAILINANEAKVSLTQIKDNTISDIAKVICSNPTDISLNPYYAVGKADDIIHANHGLNGNANDDYFTMKDSDGNSLTIYGNAVIVGSFIIGNDDDLELVYTDVAMTIADLVGEIKFFKNTKTIN